MDIRDLVTGRPIDFKKTEGMYVVKVHPHRAILENDYFIKAIEQAETLRDEEIMRYEAGLDEPDATTQLASADSKRSKGETDWEKIQRLPDADYL